MISSIRYLTCYVLLLALFSKTAHSLPNIVFILADDQGQHSVGFNNVEIKSPYIDALASTGVLFEEFYTYIYCSPTRAAILTGRYPWKAEGVRGNLEPLGINLEGTNLGFTFLPQRLKEKGYATHHIGKWHQGFHDYRYTPTARGFDTTLGFFGGQEAHFSQEQIGPNTGFCGASNTIYDIWNGNPAAHLLGVPNDKRFTQEAVDVINNHASTYGTAGGVPLFIYLAYNSPHSPIEAEQEYLDRYPDISYTLQKTFYAMISSLDDGVNNVTTALKSSGLWDNTILVWQTDNGSPIAQTTGGVCGSNYPLRGAKSSNWEGGIRVPALVNGGYLPDSQRGKRLSGIGHVSDWYATFLTLAGLDPEDLNPSSPSPIDSINLWPWISGEVSSSPLTVVVLDHNTIPNKGLPAKGAIRIGDYKLLVGPQLFASWYGGSENNYFSPNESVPLPNQLVSACTYTEPCLFDVVNDPTEHNDLASVHPDVTATLLAAFHTYDTAYHIPVTVPVSDGTAYCAHLATNGYVVAPYTNIGYPLPSAVPTSAPTKLPTASPSLAPSIVTLAPVTGAPTQKKSKKTKTILKRF